MSIWDDSLPLSLFKILLEFSISCSPESKPYAVAGRPLMISTLPDSPAFAGVQPHWPCFLIILPPLSLCTYCSFCLECSFLGGPFSFSAGRHSPIVISSSHFFFSWLCSQSGITLSSSFLLLLYHDFNGLKQHRFTFLELWKSEV